MDIIKCAETYSILFFEVVDVVIEESFLRFVLSNEHDHSLDWIAVQVLKVGAVAHIEVV